MDQSVIPWKDRLEVSITCSRKIKGGNYVQIATIDKNGLPNCRTVVFRGLMTSSSIYYQNSMKMITDSRSEKVNQIQFSPFAELVWWFSQSSEQYRISGNIQIVSEETEDEELVSTRKQMWGNLSDPAREQFYWSSPGIEYEGIASVPLGGRDIEGKVLHPPPNFLLMLLIPHKIKYLRLSDNFAQIDELADNKQTWLSKRVNP